jgi:hypothetical protein
MINRTLSLGKAAIIGLSVISLSTVALGAQAAIVVQNPDFVPSNTSASAYVGGTTVTIPGWTTTGGYTFAIPDGTAVSTNIAVNGNAPYGALALYTPGQSVSSPDGSGWFLAADGAFQVAPISQTLTGFTPGTQYYVTFSQAAGQQQNYTGATTEQWQVSLGGTSELSSLINHASQAPVSPWQPQGLLFTATAATQTLSFLAVGTPAGLPPFSLLSGVSVTVVPEPLAIVGAAVALGLGAGLKSKLAKRK